MEPRATKMGLRSAISLNFPMQLTAGGQNQRIPTQQEIVCGTDMFQGADALPFPDWIMIMMDI